MKPFPQEIWTSLERSLACVAEGKRLIEEAQQIRAESKVLRLGSAELVRSKPIGRKQNYRIIPTPEVDNVASRS